MNGESTDLQAFTGQQLPKNGHGKYTCKWLSDMVVADRQGVIR